MMNLIQLLTDQRAYEGITQSRRGVHHGIGDGEGLVMTKIEDPPLRSPKQTPNLASRWRTGGGGGSVTWNVIILSPWFFSGNMGFYSVGLEVSGATRWAAPTRARLGGLALPSGLCPPRCPPRVHPSSRNSLLYCIKNPCKVSFHSENFYFCTKTTPW